MSFMLDTVLKVDKWLTLEVIFADFHQKCSDEQQKKHFEFLSGRKALWQIHDRLHTVIIALETLW